MQRRIEETMIGPTFSIIQLNACYYSVLFTSHFQAMQTHAAVFREGSNLQAGCDKLSAIYNEMLNDIKVGSHCVLGERRGCRRIVYSVSVENENML